jgi:hypothetical protein|tara:strand:- start:126 stop:716 length:591 start_codon:yes stop_codon:yes gene_type:complete
MANLLHSGDLNTLKLGQTLLTRFRKIEGGFVQMELAEVKEGSRGLSAAFVFNQSDNRFSRNSARRAWQPATPADVESTLGISVGDDQAWEMDETGNEILTVNILNPVANYEGQEFPLRVQIIETTEPTDWQAANVQSSAKRKGKGGDFILHNGDYIFTRSSIIFNEPVDVFLDADTAETKKPVIERVDVATGEIMS